MDLSNRFILRHRTELRKFVKKNILDKEADMQYLDRMDILIR
jgi:hypothetical protein